MTDRVTIERETLKRLIAEAHHSGDSFADTEVIALAEEALAAQPAELVGDVVVSCNEDGQIVAVTRQDDEGRILSVIAEAQPAPSHRAPSHRLSDARTGDIRLACHA